MGQIRGHVETEQGDRLQQATVTLFDEQLKILQNSTTDAQGIYSFSNIPAGSYHLETVAQGYRSQRKDGIRVRQEVLSQINFRLSPVQQTRSIEEAEARGEEERNPNIFIAKIDLNALRDPLTRQGIDPVFLEFSPLKNFYGADMGAPLRQIPIVQPGRPLQKFHGSLYEAHQNSAFNARPFFNVGPLRPSHSNQFGFGLSGPLKSKLFFNSSLDITRRIGFVNGNVRVPLPEERVPIADDPLTNQVVAALLKGYPAEAPNLPDVTSRQLNTNAEEDITSKVVTFKLDYAPGDRDTFAFRYAITDFFEEPFEFAAGNNPQTSLRPQNFSATYIHTRSPTTEFQGSIDFDRLAALLLLTERFNSLLKPLGFSEVPDISLGGSFADLTWLGPGPQFPRRRFRNRFSGQLDLSLLRNRHSLQFGGSLTRVQVNDLQSDNTRGRFLFGNNFGRTAVENFLSGTPNRFTVTLGNLYRGFRYWESSLYVQDTFQPKPGLTFNLGLRYELTTTPSEVNGLDEFAFADAHNFAPQIGFAWSPRGDSVVVRGGGGISFGQIPTATFQVARFNPPAVGTITVQNPSLVNPLENVQIVPGEPQRLESNLLSPDLVPPYSYQYNLRIETRLSENLLFQIGYIGSRTQKLFFPFITNRGRPVPGIPATTATIDERRPDPRFLRVKNIINSGRSYYDALKVGLTHRFAKGLSFDVDYTFSKDLTSGSDFASTLNPERGRPSPQSDIEFQADVRGPSPFDVRHGFTVTYTYEVPFPALSGGISALLLGGWKISGSTAYRSGVVFTINTSSDAPGFGNVDGQGGDRPNITHPAILGKSIDDPDTSTSILNPKFFNTDIPVGGKGNLGFRVFRKDSLSNTNLALTKNFPLVDETRLEFRTEFSNLFNHPWFSRPGDVFPSPVFGKIIDTQNKGRVIQFSLILTF